MMQVELSASAEDDLVLGYRFYEAKAPQLGTYFLDSLYADIDSLRLYAGIHAKPSQGLHRTTGRRFPFSIYYRVAGDVATVVAVLDSRQNPKRTEASLSARLN
jgi:plasmid stabilization system protein ParE